MGDETVIHAGSGAGVTASHATLTVHPVVLGTATGSEANTVSTGIIPIACWRVDDVRFAFDSSLVKPELATEMEHLAKLREAHKLELKPDTAKPAVAVFPRMSVFGHADPTGNDDYNKQLSGRRATAIFAMLIRDTDLWEDLYSHPLGNDKWGRPALELMLSALGSSAEDAASGAEDADADKPKRAQLFLDYMDLLCGKDFRLKQADDFLAGSDERGKGDYQGCGEFNPMMLFSQKEEVEFSKKENEESRNEENAQNRRVVVLLFRPGLRVKFDKWPCPRAKEGAGGCRKRFWSDSEKRRSRHLPDDRREFKATQDTFACRFYHRLSTGSPCEEPVALTTLTIRLIDDLDRPMEDTPYRLEIGFQKFEGKTKPGGILSHDVPASAGSAKLFLTEKVFRRKDSGTGEVTFDVWSLDLEIVKLEPANTMIGAKTRLNNLGLYADPVADDVATDRTRRALERFQQRAGILPGKGDLDEKTAAKLKERYGS